ncbi:MAG TPA: hypothetical protein VF698_16055 [Thermoanaerobaculia bacterium]|jgi:hypothetical protein
MRKSTTLALVLTAVLTVTATAAPHQSPQRGRDRADAVETVKKWVKRVFEIITVPIPRNP